MNMCIELIGLNDTYDVSHWMNRSTLFGVSEERDLLLTRNIEIIQSLFALGDEKGFYNFNSFHDGSGKIKCYAILFSDDLTAIKTLFHSDIYKEYVESTNQLCKIYGWTYHGHKVIPNSVLSTVNLEHLIYDTIDGLWGKTIPIFPPM